MAKFSSASTKAISDEAMLAKASAAPVASGQETLDKEWATASDKAIAGSATGLRPFLHVAARTGWLPAETSVALTVLSVEIGAGFRTEVAADSAGVAAAFVEAVADVAVVDAADDVYLIVE